VRGAALVATLLSGSAVADEAQDREEAKSHFQRGMAHFRLDEFEEAAREFLAGYRAHPDALFLLNAGQAYRLGHRPREALEYYEKYLKYGGEVPNRAEVKQRVAELRKLVAESNQVESRSPTNLLSPPSTKPAEQAPPEQKQLELMEPELKPDEAKPPPPSVPTPAVAAAAVLAKPAAPARPIWKRWWLWTAVAALVVVAVGVGLAIALAPPSEQTLPDVVLH
jgi:tetratricopeptide (TPR) repeat protein